VSPRADLLLFVATDPKTGKGDVCTVPVGGGEVTRLTNTPDVDETDPAWSRDGTRVAFASDRPAKEGEKVGDYNIWVLDLAKPGEPTQVTANSSWDDNPAWDAMGQTLYFRSNRGGQWGIWKIDLK
jgi:Tol biopolymer transport system component